MGLQLIYNVWAIVQDGINKVCNVLYSAKSGPAIYLSSHIKAEEESCVAEPQAVLGYGHVLNSQQCSSPGLARLDNPPSEGWVVTLAKWDEIIAGMIDYDVITTYYNNMMGVPVKMTFQWPSGR